MENLAELMAKLDKDGKNEKVIDILDKFNKRLNLNPLLLKARNHAKQRQHQNENK